MIFVLRTFLLHSSRHKCCCNNAMDLSLAIVSSAEAILLLSLMLMLMLPLLVLLLALMVPMPTIRTMHKINSNIFDILRLLSGSPKIQKTEEPTQETFCSATQVC